jgi:hypothetical protein
VKVRVTLECFNNIMEDAILDLLRTAPWEAKRALSAIHATARNADNAK